MLESEQERGTYKLFVTATGWKQLKTQRCRAKSLRRLRMSLE